MTQNLSFRPITDADLELLFRMFSSTRTAELAVVPWTDLQKENFLRMQFRAQHTHYQAHYADAQFEILNVKDLPAGRLYVHRSPTEITIIDITILPEYRGAGIGTFLITQLINEAQNTGLPLRLHVETHNPAYRLYSRLGFHQVEDTGVYHKLEWSPGAP